MLETLAGSGELVWFHQRGIGYVDPAAGHNYGADYFQEFERRAEDELGKQLMQARVNLVSKYLTDDDILVDVGIGSGAFITARGAKTYGYDVNPWGIAWLIARELYWDLEERGRFFCASFWDVLEHMEDPAKVIRMCGRRIFISIPIFEGPDDVLASKHYKPGEHLWYFTESGLIQLVREQGFELIENNRMECDLGREGIGTFVFARM